MMNFNEIITSKHWLKISRANLPKAKIKTDLEIVLKGKDAEGFYIYQFTFFAEIDNPKDLEDMGAIEFMFKDDFVKCFGNTWFEESKG